MPDTTILPTILLLDPDRALRTVLTQGLGRAGYQVRAGASGHALMAWLEDGEGEVLIADRATLAQGDLAASIARLHPGLAVLRLGNPATGPIDLPKPFDLPVLLDRVSSLLRLPKEAPRHAAPRAPAALSGTSRAIEALREGVIRLSATHVPVLILGERGTGRARVARALHDAGPGREAPMIAGDVSRIAAPDQAAWLVDLAARAGHGTLSLARIETLSAQGQDALSTLLEDHARPLACRLVTAADGDLEQLVAKGLFRPDLRYRLGAAELHVPALHERLEDVPMLATLFWQAAHVGVPAHINDNAARALADHPWPDNLGGLKATIGRIAAASHETILTEAMVRAALAPQPVRPSVNQQAPEHFAEQVPAETESFSDAIARQIARYLAAHDPACMPEGHLHDDVIAVVERPLIAGVLAATGGNQIRAAAILGLNRNTLRKRIRDLDITPPRSRRASTL